MNPRLEVFCSIDPEEGREFVAILSWFRTNKDGTLFPLSHLNFYASSARDAKATAEAWLEREQARLIQKKVDADRRVAERTRRAPPKAA